MSIWLHALAGGVQGLGQSIATGDAEKREARGVALREKYLMARQKQGQDFSAGQADLERGHESGEREKDRTQRGTMHTETIAAGAANTATSIAAADARAERSDTSAMERLTADNAAADDRLDKQLAASHSAAVQRLEAQISGMSQGPSAADNVALRAAVSKLPFLQKEVLDEEGNVVQEASPDPELVQFVVNFMQEPGNGGKAPWNVNVTAEDLRTAMNEEGKGLNEVLSWHLDHGFNVTQGIVKNLRASLADDEKTRAHREEALGRQQSLVDRRRQEEEDAAAAAERAPGNARIASLLERAKGRYR